MGKKSRLKNLGHDLKTRIQFSPLATIFNKGKLTGQTLKAYKKMRPLMDHVDNDNCKYCIPLFQQIKTCKYIKDLPESSFEEANRHIMTHKPCAENLKKIMECPNYKV